MVDTIDNEDAEAGPEPEGENTAPLDAAGGAEGSDHAGGEDAPAQAAPVSGPEEGGGAVAKAFAGFKEVKPRMTLAERREARRKAAEEQKAAQAKKGEQGEEARQSETDDEIEAALAGSTVQAKYAKKKKKTIRTIGTLISTVILVYGIYLLFKPFQAPLTYGVCRVFLELNVQFPDTLRLSTAEQIGNTMRIWYTQVDAFGQYRMENIQCRFERDEKMGFRVEKILINRREIAPERVEAFNNILPVILADPPNLDYPAPIPDALKDVQIDADTFRTPLF
ncbi:MAG: hypothetical protein KDJ75_07645 [Alphaproteobacteria bacterium]|nr:hypothetical protein [Alphaproteobacteria bacterium]